MEEDETGTTNRTRTNLKYMNRPPRIIPNYGKKIQSVLPKTCISRVLLYDNVTQQQMLDVKLSQIKHEKQKASRVLDLHRKSFVLRRRMKQQYTLAHQTKVDKTSPLYNGLQSETANLQNDSVKLPTINGHSNRVGAFPLKMENTNGITRLMHTFSEDKNSVALLEWTKKNMMNEKRYERLVKLLVELEEPGDGYIELSPSFPKKIAAFPEHVVAFCATRAENSNTDVNIQTSTSIS
ncbi:uncharacterized protein LOC121381850 [Gigantopelta aegis]|uniref:uncharacterized protein LOC121381850 n=1 Tax=Gigantopelta aegis TaxID=1735272 RepID=UPI001B88749E|nr:uncharacterized protein LOC121381850 [Gigantopelta aegis]XP_041367154.1 uncharacterized protein LOC121381850 [Gigantopelta aegis]